MPSTLTRVKYENPQIGDRVHIRGENRDATVVAVARSNKMVYVFKDQCLYAANDYVDDLETSGLVKVTNAERK